MLASHWEDGEKSDDIMELKNKQKTRHLARTSEDRLP